MASEDFFAFIFAFYNVIEPSKSFATAYYNVRRGSAALQRIDEQIGILKLQDDRTVGNQSILSFRMQSIFNVEDLSFKYDNDWVLVKYIHFELKKGETVAIVGASGSGKTTLNESPVDNSC